VNGFLLGALRAAYVSPKFRTGMPMVLWFRSSSGYAWAQISHIIIVDLLLREFDSLICKADEEQEGCISPFRGSRKAQDLIDTCIGSF
jgi:hypothetical protein